jgi:hypothetical protein
MSLLNVVKKKWRWRVASSTCKLLSWQQKLHRPKHINAVSTKDDVSRRWPPSIRHSPSSTRVGTPGFGRFAFENWWLIRHGRENHNGILPVVASPDAG